MNTAPKHTIRLFFVISLFFISYSSYAQQTILTNPSFEATAPCENCIAPTWTNCANTPDVLNGDNSIWCVDFPPQQGSTYAGITNGEYIGQYLSCPLVAGRTYNMTVWLAYDNVYASTMVLGACADYRNNPGNLEIIGGFNSCQVDEVLWTSGILTGPSDTWVQYTATFTPSATYDYVMFRNNRIGPTGGNNATGGSNVCMDNFDLIGDEATITSTDATCSGFGNDGEATVFPPNNGTNWGIVWSDGQTTPTATNLAAGTYTVTLTDLDGFCQVPITLTVIIDGPPLISASGTPDIICSGDNVQLNVSVAAPPPPAPCVYTLNLFDSFGDGWGNSNGDGYVQVYVNGVLIGTYYVLTNQTNYSTTFSVYQGDNIQLIYSASGIYNNENSYQLLNASSAIVYSSGTNPANGSGWTGTANCGNPPPPTYTYSWSPSTTLSNSSIANPVATPTTTTTYTVSVVSSNNLSCPAKDSVTITINPTASGTDVITSCMPISWIDGNNYTASTNTPTFTIAGGSYQGCDSVVTLNLTINTFASGTDVQTTCNSYTWIDGNNYTSSTNTPTFTIAGGSSEGCDSIVTLNLTINNSTTGTDIQTACNSYTWIDGINYTASTNTPTYTIAGGSVEGCDSIVTLNLTINNSTTGTDIQTACNSYTWIDGINYTASTNTPTYTIVGGSSEGCDSIVTLNLTINTFASGTDVQTACNSYTWIDGNNYTASTNTPTYTIAGGSSQGCDSIVTLNLTTNTFASGADVQTACNSYTWIDGNNYTVSTNTPTYTIAGGSSEGCDSIVTLNLTINNSTTGTDIQTACNSYTWIDGINYTASTNTPTFTIAGGSSQGCDSVVTLNLTINTFASGTDVQTACNNYTWIDGNNYTASTNTPTFTIVGGSSQGCDSVVTLNLTINTFASGTDVQTACNSYTWIDGNNYTASTNTPTFTMAGGSFQGCDSVVTLNLTINTFASGTDVQTACNNYTWIDGNNYTSSTNTPTFTIAGGSFQGCDSIVTLNLTINNSTTGTDIQTACNSYTWIDGINYTASTNTPTFTIAGGSVQGCDSIVTLNLTINTFASGADVQTACNNYTWIDGNTYTSSTNTPTYTIAGGSFQGCDSIVTLNLTINTFASGTDVQTACSSYTWIDGNNYTASTNTPTFTIAGGSVQGCDSIVTLNLTINTFASGTDVQTACNSYTWIDGNTYTSSTNTPTYTIAGGSVEGCDSVVTLNLTINTFASGTDVQTACNSYTWIDGNNYTESTNTPTFTIAGGSVQGCDSIVTLNLTINNSTTGTDMQTACNNYTWIDGNNYTASTNTPTFTIAGGSVQGCDSIVTLNLTINNSTTGTDVQTACNSYTWIDGNNYTASTNTPTFTIAGGAANGCDSIVTLNLTVNSNPTVNAGVDQSVCEGTSVTLSGSGAISYTWDNGVTDGTAFTPTSTTTYTVTGTDANNCSNIDQVTVTVNNCTQPQPKASFIASSTTICIGENITFTDNSTGVNVNSWNWTFNGGTPNTANTQGAHTVTFNTAGTFNITLQVTDDNGTDDTTIVVHVISLPIADFIHVPTEVDDDFNSEITFTDNSVVATDWYWNFGDGSISTQQHPVHVYADSGTYLVTLFIENNYGCKNSIQKSVRIDPIFTIWIPNAFTPDGDDVNDYFTVKGYGIAQLDVMVFDKWGELLYNNDDKEDLEPKWDGMYKNILLKNDVYAYKIKVKDVLGRWYEFIGRVTLMN